MLFRFQQQNHTTLADLVAHFNFEFLHHTGNGRRHIHRGLVGFQRDKRLLRHYAITHFNQHLDDGNVLEVADVRYFDCDGWSHNLSRDLLGLRRPTHPTMA